MIRNLLLGFCMLLSFGWQFAFSQTTVKGKVTSAEDQTGLPGVNVLVKGTTNGTITDYEGAYSVEIPEGTEGILIFTFVGMETQEITVAGRSEINVELAGDATQLSEVVVTALGIEREEASLGYSIQEVESEQLQVVRQEDVRTALAGKVSGIQVQGSAGSTFGASTIRIRGVNGLNDNGPLYVVDGTPANPSTINMDDVESVSVLKGASAAALYGSRAGGGVVMITTKKGKTGEAFNVEFNSTLTFEKVRIPFEFQNQYGGGYSQNFDTFHYDPAIHPQEFAALDGSPMAQFYADESWGAPLDGTEVLQWDSFYKDMANYGKTTPFAPTSSDVDEFFETGRTFNNNLAFSAGTENSTFRFSYGNIAQSGIIPNSENDKHSFSFNATTKVKDKFEITPNVIYSTHRTQGRLNQGYANLGSNLWHWWQRQINVKDLEQYKTPEGDLKTWNPEDVNNGNYAPSYWNSPYADLYDNPDVWNTSRLLANLTLKYNFNENFSVSAIARTYNYNRGWEGKLVEGTYRNGLVNDGLAWFGTSNDKIVENNYEAMVQYNKEFGDFSVNALVGGNIRNRKNTYMYMATKGGLSDPDLFNIGASIERPDVSNYFEEKEVRSLYGSATFGYKNFLYVDLTARNDWSSTLPTSNNSYFYPSASASFVFSELLESNIISFGKIRAGVASVGSDTNPYSVNTSYSNGTVYGNNPSLNNPDKIINSNLKPTISSEYELGLNMMFLQRRIGFDFAIYNKDSKNQILELTIPGSTGSSSALINAGLINNKGWELGLTGSPLQNDKWNIDLGFNIARNRSKVVELYTNSETGQQLSTYVLGSTQWDMATIYAREGSEWGMMVWDDALTYYQATDADGNPVDHPSNGQVVIEDDGNYFWGNHDVDAGSVLPEYTGGFYGNIGYKNFNLSFSMDYQVGGKLYSLSSRFNRSSGHNAETAGNNDKGNPIRSPVAEGGGVRVDGVLEDGTPHTAYLDAQTYFKNKRFYEDQFTYDASYVKMREINLSYTFGQSIVDKTPFKLIQLGVVLKNPWIFYKDSEVDPSELENTGYEDGQLPGTRSLGFNLKLNF